MWSKSKCSNILGRILVQQATRPIAIPDHNFILKENFQFNFFRLLQNGKERKILPKNEMVIMQILAMKKMLMKNGMNELSSIYSSGWKKKKKKKKRN